MPAALPRQAVLHFDTSEDADTCAVRLAKAFDEPRRDSGFLALAEPAVGAHPDNPVILMLAATAALLEHRPQRALVFLKRISKRYNPTQADCLLNALALFQLNKRVAARGLLEQHGLTEWPAAIHAFLPSPYSRTLA